MITVKVSLPESLRSFIDEQVRKEGFSSTSEYIRNLLREAEKQHAQQAAENQVFEALQGKIGDFSPEEWEELKSLVRSRRNLAPFSGPRRA